MGLIKAFDLSTVEGRQAQLLDKLSLVLTSHYKYLMNAGNGISGMIFSSPGLTPQQACDALGPQASVLLGVGQAVAGILNGLQPGSMNLTPPKTSDGKDQVVVVNQDGTVTISVIEPQP